MPKPKRIEAELELGAAKPHPPKPDEAGATKSRARVTLELAHKGEKPERLTTFLAGVAGDLLVAEISTAILVEDPAGGEAKPLEWRGFVTAGAAKLSPPAMRSKEQGTDEFPTVTLALEAEANGENDLPELLRFRCALGEAAEFRAAVVLEQYQGKLFGEAEG